MINYRLGSIEIDRVIVVVDINERRWILGGKTRQNMLVILRVPNT